MKSTLCFAAIGLACLASTGVHAASSATAQLESMDKTSYSAHIVARITQYAPPPKGKAQYPQPSVDSAELLIERPDRFRLVLRPGAKDELIFVAQAGITHWKDNATGFTGKAPTSEVADPLALIALGTAGELKRYAQLSELDTGKSSPLRAARLDPRAYGTGVERAIAWFGNDEPMGYGFEMKDGSRVYIAFVTYKANVETKPGDFEL